jgi:pimeloyl-ACP methyl ester carboxylesterase
MTSANSQSSTKQSGARRGVRNVVLVHGAWADASNWAKVIPLLQAKDLHVVAVQNPLTSLADDVATTKRAIALQDGPVLLVGHSYGGAVITEAGNDPKVAGLLYIAAFAPQAGEAAGDLGKDFPVPPGILELRPDASGFLSLTPKGMYEDFAQDLTDAEKAVLLATQHPTAGAALGGKVTTAAWKSKPAWYLIAQHDRMIAPDFQKVMAGTIKAQSTSLPCSHVAMLARPAEVAAFIESAACDLPVAYRPAA